MISAAPSALDSDAVRATVAGLKAWICSGACQSLSGAFVAWVDLVSGRLAFDYAEITGYALTYLAHQGSLAAELTVGRRAADWLVARLRRGALAARDGWDGDAVYLFDLGMIATGLLSFGRRTRTERYIDAGRSLVDLIGDELGAGQPAALARSGPRSARSSWSTRGTAHLTKLAQPFLLCGRTEPAAALVENALSLQRSDGRFPTSEDEATTMLHPHMYAAEGLWVWGAAHGDEDAVEHARAALGWAWSYQLESGGLPRAVTRGRVDGPEQCDLTAQAVRLSLAMGWRSPAVERGIRRLVEVARERRGKLALPYQPESPEQHLNTWATLFGAQALELAAQARPALAWAELV